MIRIEKYGEYTPIVCRVGITALSYAVFNLYGWGPRLKKTTGIYNTDRYLTLSFWYILAVPLVFMGMCVVYGMMYYTGYDIYIHITL